MNIEYYQTFVAVAKANSFSKAAEQLNIVQSTVSSRIQELESYLENKLFIRNNRTVELSHAGKVFLPYAEKMLRTEKEGLRKMSTLKLYEDGLKISVNGNIYREILRPIVQKFADDYPQYTISIDFHGTYSQLDMLFENEIDIGFIGRKPNTQRLSVKHFCDFKMILVAPKDYPVNSVINADELLSLKFFYSDHNIEFNHWLSDILSANYKSHVNVNHYMHLLNIVNDGIGCAFLPDNMVQAELKSGNFKEIMIHDVEPLIFSNYIAVNKKRKDTAVVQAFLNLLPSI